MKPIARNTIIGDRDGRPVDEAEHYGRSPRCRATVDMRDLGAVLDHNNDEPCPVQDRLQ